MLDALFFASASVYGLAGALFLGTLLGKGARPVRSAARVLAAAATLHAAHLVARWATVHVGPFAGLREALSSLALLSVVAFLVVRRRDPRLDIVGAFVTPVALVMLLGSFAPLDRARAFHGGLLFAVHIGSNLLAIAAFTVAFGMSVAYLLQERQVKRKQLAGLFNRLPPLEEADQVAYRCVIVGLPALTLGLVTGLFVEGLVHDDAVWQEVFGLGAWTLFAAVLLLRAVAGWRGRRAAIGTILGYASALLVLLGYVVRRAGS